MGVSMETVEGSPKVGSLTGVHEERSMSESLVVDVATPVAAVWSLTPPRRRWSRGEGVTRNPSCQSLSVTFPNERGHVAPFCFAVGMSSFSICPTILGCFQKGHAKEARRWVGCSRLRTLPSWLRVEIFLRPVLVSSAEIPQIVKTYYFLSGPPVRRVHFRMCLEDLLKATACRIFSNKPLNACTNVSHAGAWITP